MVPIFMGWIFLLAAFFFLTFRTLLFLAFLLGHRLQFAQITVFAAEVFWGVFDQVDLQVRPLFVRLLLLFACTLWLLCVSRLSRTAAVFHLLGSLLSSVGYH